MIAHLNAFHAARHLRAFNARLRNDPKVGHVTQRHLQILALCCASEDPLPVRTIAEEVGLSRSATSRAIDRMAERNLITFHRITRRADDGDNRRAFAVSPTHTGRVLDRHVQRLYAEAGEKSPASLAVPA